jgi:hypothetical protein
LPSYKPMVKIYIHFLVIHTNIMGLCNRKRNA